MNAESYWLTGRNYRVTRLTELIDLEAEVRRTNFGPQTTGPAGITINLAILGRFEGDLCTAFQCINSV